MGSEAKIKLYHKWWWLLPLLPCMVLVLLLLFPKAWLNSDIVHQQITRFAADRGVTLSYGVIVSFSWWHGITVEKTHIAAGGISVDLNDLTCLLKGDLDVSRAAINVVPSFIKFIQKSQGGQSPNPFLLSLMPRHVQIKQLDVIAPQGEYSGTIAVNMHEDMSIDASMRGLWHIHADGKILSGTVDTAFQLESNQNNLNISRLNFKNDDAAISVRNINISNLRTVPRFSAASFSARCRIAPFFTGMIKWIDLPPRLRSIRIEGRDFHFADQVADLMLKQLFFKTKDGSHLDFSGPVAWSGKQQSLIESKGLSFQGEISHPSSWGIAVNEASHLIGTLRGSFGLGESGAIKLQDTAIESQMMAGDKHWKADLSVVLAQITTTSLRLEQLKGVFESNAPILVAGHQIRAGKYQLLLKDSHFTWNAGHKAGKRIDWQETGTLKLAMPDMLPLDLDVSSRGVRVDGKTVITRLMVAEKHYGMMATVQGALRDDGFSHRGDFLQGTLSMERLSALKPWIHGWPDLEGRGKISLKLESKGRQILSSRGRIRLSELSLHQSDLILQHGMLNLPFKQRLNIRRMALLQGKGMNLSDLSQLRDTALPGALKIGSLSAGTLKLTDVQLGLLFHDGVVAGKLNSGMLLDGGLSGYFQLEMPKNGRPYPDAFARFALIHADVSRLNPARTANESRLNLYGTIKSDGKAFSGRMSVPDMQRDSMRNLIVWLDPKGKNDGLTHVQQMMDQYGFVPSSADARLQNRYVDLDVALRSRSGSDMKIPIHNLSVGHLISQALGSKSGLFTPASSSKKP